MKLTFDPQQTYVETLMQLSDEKLRYFFDRLGVEKTDNEVTFFDDDEGLIYDDEG